MPRRKTQTAAAEAGPPQGTVQLVACECILFGDEGNVATFDMDRPATYPELLVLEQIHYPSEGSKNPISRVRHLGYVKRTPRAERDRLREKYHRNARVVDALFPGANPAASMATSDPNNSPAPGTECVIGDFVGVAPRKAGAPARTPPPAPAGADDAGDDDQPMLFADDADAQDGGVVSTGV